MNADQIEIISRKSEIISVIKELEFFILTLNSIEDDQVKKNNELKVSADLALNAAVKDAISIEKVGGNHLMFLGIVSISS